jgi:hypothetical protein
LLDSSCVGGVSYYGFGFNLLWWWGCWWWWWLCQG